MFCDPCDFPFVATLESRWRDIRNEFEQLSPADLMPWPETDLYNRGWEVFGLWAMGKRLTKNCRLCPRTADAVELIPGLTTAGFSRLAPGTRIRPHVGYTNSVLRCHMGIVIPGQCGLCVAGESRHWEEGKCLVFDDTALHSAWNDSNDPRIVLLVDFLREGRQFDFTIPDDVAEMVRASEKRHGSEELSRDRMGPTDDLV